MILLLTGILETAGYDGITMERHIRGIFIKYEYSYEIQICGQNR